MGVNVMCRRQQAGGGNPARSPQSEAPPENPLRHNHDKKDGAHHGIKAEEGDIDPIQTAPARNPVFQHEARHNDGPTHEVGDAKSAQQTEREEQAAHDEVREERGGERVLRSPSHDERTQPVAAVEFVILQRVDDVEAHEPQNHRRRQHQHLQPLQRRNIRSLHRQPRAHGRQRQREAEKDMRVIREALGQRIETNHPQRNRRKVKA